MIALENREIPTGAVISALALLIVAAATQATVARYPSGEFHHDLTSPVLAIELAASPDEVSSIFSVDPSHKLNLRGMLYWNTVFDCAFILAYSAFLWTLSEGLGRAGLRPVIRILICATAIADYGENAGLFQTLRGSGWASWTLPASLVKWGLFNFVLLLIAAQLWKTRLRPYDRTITGILTIVVFAAGLIGLTGLGNGPETFLVGVFAYRHLAIGVGLFSLLPLAVLAGAFLRWRGVAIDDAAPSLPEN